MRRGLALALVFVTVSLPGAAQNPGPRLHRFIPGDLSLGELPPGVLATPESLDDFRRAASGTGWSERQDPPTSILHPRDNWESVSRTMDSETRSPAGATLRYREVFSPSVAPFKRTHAYDAVDELGRLTVRDPSLRPLRVGEVPSAWARERAARFTADVHVELSATSPTPIPSVAAEQAVLSFRTEPEVPVAFFHDSAGNLFVRAETTRTVHLSYVLAAPQHAFVAPADAVPSYPPGSPALRGPEPEPVVPAFLASSYGRVLAQLGARRSDPLRPTLDSLVRHFRAYRDAALPITQEPTLYARLALGGVGACRHRAYAFALTLHALGVPARYVGNEAHAWAEVYLAGTGWTRIDLGGWDVNLRDEGEARERFVPENPDPFPRPEGYANGYSTYGAAAPPDDPRHRGRRRPDEPQNQGLGPGRDDPSQGVPSQGGNAQGDPSRGGNGQGAAANAPGGPRRAGARDVGTPMGDGAEGAAEADDPPGAAPANDGSLDVAERHRTELRLTSVQSSEAHGGNGVVRGTLVVCAGEARDETGAPIEDLPVLFELVQGNHVVVVMRNGRRESALGTTVTNDHGRFEARVMLPLELEAGTYSIRARTPGDTHHTPARVE